MKKQITIDIDVCDCCHFSQINPYSCNRCSFCDSLCCDGCSQEISFTYDLDCKLRKTFCQTCTDDKHKKIIDRILAAEKMHKHLKFFIKDIDNETQ